MANLVKLQNNLPEWLHERKNRFQPPVCLQEMYNSQLTMIFLRGPNSRQDFHIEEGEEIFCMLEGEMNLKVVDRNKFRNIIIKAGELFVLPARVQHSPRRPDNSLGYVIERRRIENLEYDGLIYYDEKEDSDSLLKPKHEVYGYIGHDFQRDVSELIKSANHDIKLGNVTSNSTNDTMPLVTPDHNANLPDPISIKEFIEKNYITIKQNGIMQIFPELNQTKIEILCEREHNFDAKCHDQILWIYKGAAELNIFYEDNEDTLHLIEQDFLLLKTGAICKLRIDQDSFVLRMQMANK